MSVCVERSKIPTDSDSGKSNHRRCIRRYVVLCTPCIAFSAEMQSYIEQQCRSRSKRWIYEILDGTRETRNVKYEDNDCVLLPDTEVLNDKDTLNWLAIFKVRRVPEICCLESVGKAGPNCCFVL